MEWSWDALFYPLMLIGVVAAGRLLVWRINQDVRNAEVKHSEPKMPTLGSTNATDVGIERSGNVEKIVLRCPDCSDEKIIEKCCTVTGFVYGSGWVIRCDCGQSMQAVRKDETCSCECDRVLQEIDFKSK
jgi:hypothetical protein